MHWQRQCWPSSARATLGSGRRAAVEEKQVPAMSRSINAIQASENNIWDMQRPQIICVLLLVNSDQIHISARLHCTPTCSIITGWHGPFDSAPKRGANNARSVTYSSSCHHRAAVVSSFRVENVQFLALKVRDGSLLDWSTFCHSSD